jgi:hypothetical protein
MRRLANDRDADSGFSSVTAVRAAVAFQAKATTCANQSAVSEAATTIANVATDIGTAINKAHAAMAATNDVLVHLLQRPKWDSKKRFEPWSA